MTVPAKRRSENRVLSGANHPGRQLMLPSIRISQCTVKEKYLLPPTIDHIVLPALAVLLLLIENSCLASCDGI